MHRHKPDFILLFVVLALVAFGIVMVYSASMVWAIQVNLTSPSYFVKHQLLSAIIGLIAMFILMNIPFTTLMKFARPISLLSVASLFAVLIPGIGHKAQGVRRWIGPEFLQFQPSELALVGVLIYLAYIYSKNEKRMQSLTRGVLPPFMMVGVQFLAILLEPDMGTSVLLLLSGLTVMFAAGVKKRHMALLTVVLLPIVAGFAWFESYRNTRLLVFLHPWNPAYTNKGGYQLQQSLIAIFHGGFFGSGLGRGIEPFLYLPIPYADFIFSVIVEELGFIGAVALLACYAVLVWRGIRIGQLSNHRFASLLAIGITIMIGYGVIINVGAVTGLLPVTGIPLPFVSYGGTALIVKLCAVGILLSISRYTSEQGQPIRQPVAAEDRLQPFPQSRTPQGLTRSHKKRVGNQERGFFHE